MSLRFSSSFRAPVFLLLVAAILFVHAFTSVRATSTDGVPQFGNVFVIVGENEELTSLNSSNSPYLIGTIQRESAWLTGYYAVTHHSEANYVAMTSGQFNSCQQNDGPPASCTENVNNLFEQLDGAGISWQEWMESMSTACSLTNTGTDANLNPYATKHNPALDYNYLVTNGTTPTAECLQRDIPTGGTGPNDMSTFNTALIDGNVVRFNYIIPNLCEDAHDDCGGSPAQITQFDTFLSNEIPLIKASSAYGSNGVIIVTFDEGSTNDNGGGNVVCAIISPLASMGQYSQTYNHYSLLRTLEDGFGISTYLGSAASASPINTIWTTTGS